MKYRIEIEVDDSHRLEFYPIIDGDYSDDWDDAIKVVDGSGTIPSQWMIPEKFYGDFLLRVYDDVGNLAYESKYFDEFYFFGLIDNDEVEVDELEEKLMALMRNRPIDVQFKKGTYLVYDSAVKQTGCIFYVETATFNPEKFRFLKLKGLTGVCDMDGWVDMTCATYDGKYITPEDGWEKISGYWESACIYILEKHKIAGNHEWWETIREIEDNPFHLAFPD